MTTDGQRTDQPIRDRPVRVGIIGCGGMAHAHVPGLANFEDVEFAGFCDVDRDRAETLATTYGVSAVFTAPEEMIRSVRPDIVYILLPPFAHGQPERAALEAAVPFFVEKPIGNDLGLLRELAAEVRVKNLLTAVGYMNRYRESVRRAKALFHEDEPVIGYGGWIGGPPTHSEAPIMQWWVVKEKSGGQLVEQVTHTVDLIRHLMGDVVEVYASAATGFNARLGNRLQPGYNIEDAEVVTLRFASGAVGTLFSSCAVMAGGSVTLNVHAAQHTVRFAGWDHSCRIYTAGNEEIEKISGEPDIFAVEDRHVINAVKTGDRALIGADYLDAFETSRVTLGANESLATGKPVSLA